MTTGHEEHAHEHTFVEIVDAETIIAFEHAPHGIITLQLHQRGFSLDLSYEEAQGQATQTLASEKTRTVVRGKG